MGLPTRLYLLAVATSVLDGQYMTLGRRLMRNLDEARWVSRLDFATDTAETV